MKQIILKQKEFKIKELNLLIEQRNALRKSKNNWRDGCGLFGCLGAICPIVWPIWLTGIILGGSKYNSLDKDVRNLDLQIQKLQLEIQALNQ